VAVQRKLSVLLMQLPFPYFGFKKHWGNIPLAAGFLKSMAFKEGLLDEIDIEILDRKTTNYSSDARLIDLLVSRAPDVIGFSLYSWNAVRSLYIAREVKQRRPGIKIIAGGSEVTLETDYLVNDPVIDIGCLGEGESTFVDILKKISGGGEDYGNVQGIFYRQEDALVSTQPRAPIPDLDQIPSPYLLGFLRAGDYGEAWLENTRGCPMKCDYCAHGTRPAGHFSEERLGEELKVIKKEGVKWVRFVNGTFMASPNFETITQTIQTVNRDRQLSFFAFINAEEVTEASADKLRACNFRALEIGLQSAKPATLKAVHRKVHLEKFLKGIKILEERNFDMTIDVIIGLPNETLKDFKETLEFLESNGINNITPFVLFMLPGTKLRRDADRYGILHQKRPPYLITKTSSFSPAEIEEAVTLVKGRPRPVFSGSLISYCSTNFPSSDNGRDRMDIDGFGFSGSLNKLILELDSSIQSDSQMTQLGWKLSRKVIQPFTVWFKSHDIEKDLHLMKSFIHPIARTNPFLLWSIVLETGQAFAPSIIEDLKKSFPSQEILFDFCRTAGAVSICAVLPETERFDEAWREEISEQVPLYRSLCVSGDFDWQGTSERVFQERYSTGLLVDIDPACELHCVSRFLEFFNEQTRLQTKGILYRNLAIYYAMGIFKNNGNSHISIRKSETLRSILSLDKRMNILSHLETDRDTAPDLAAFQMRLKRHLGHPVKNPD